MVTATEYQEEIIRDAFINGFHSQCIRQRLLENITLNLEAAYTQARSLEIAEKSSNTYSNSSPLNSLNAENEEAVALAREGGKGGGRPPMLKKIALVILPNSMRKLGRGWVSISDVKKS